MTHHLPGRGPRTRGPELLDPRAGLRPGQPGAGKQPVSTLQAGPPRETAAKSRCRAGSATLRPSGLPKKPRTLGPGKGHQPAGGHRESWPLATHRLWLSLGSFHRAASRHINGHTRKWPSGWYRAGSPHLPFPAWPIYHTESDVHYRCPGPSTHRHYPGPALRGPRQLGL